jgi:L-malate glycosyltransferase
MRGPVRVLLIAPSLDILGGQAVQAKRLFTGMQEEPSVRMGFLPINPRPPRGFGWVRDVKYVRTVSTFLIYFTRLVASAWRYDILHIFSAAYYSYLLWSVPAILVGRLYGKIVILHYHDGQCEDHLRRWRSARVTLRMAHQIVAPSGFLADVLPRLGFPARCILNNLEVERFHYRARSRLRPVFMTNRILEPLYNVDCILRAFDLIRRRFPDATLTIAHDGPSRPHLERLTRELGLENVRFLGRIPHDRVASLYDDADIYLTSPNIDCMPGSLLECFASGLPVIATRAGGIPYLLENERTGLLVPINGHREIADAAFRLLEDPALVQRLTSAALLECDRYLYPAIHAQWVALYHELEK